MTPLIWILITIGAVTVIACGVRVHRVGGPSRDVAIALPVAAVLALPGLLADEATAAAWGLWGATTIAAALTWAVADTVRDIRRQTPGKPGTAS
ncbi:hypothetical protein ACIBAG_14980 [Streptomyces sp. NPDC051243]|uniref:hypothetical protein n=1 Tax=Streptomyces sp. NPDC051243 TaxID=3365646 RepID=UPI0037B3067A